MDHPVLELFLLHQYPLFKSNIQFQNSNKNNLKPIYRVSQKKGGILNLELLKIGTSEKGGVKTNRKRRPEMIRFQNIKVISLIVPA